MKEDCAQHALQVDSTTKEILAYQYKQDRDVFWQDFVEGSSQAGLFDVVVRPLVERLIKGHDSLLFINGATGGNAKTSNMAVRGNKVGVLPHCLKSLFQTIDGYRAGKGTFQPDYFNGFEFREKFEIKNDFEIKGSNKSKLNLIDFDIRKNRKLPDIEIDLKNIEPVMPVSGINENFIYAVYISYVEIHNNSVYDLLERDPEKAFDKHIVREDPNRNMYIHGATELEVLSVEEAIEAFLIGQARLAIESGRTHSVFKIRLVRAPSKKRAQTTTEGNSITFSQLWLVDLAGGRRPRTNINSLINLRELLEYRGKNQLAIRENTSLANRVPRDSKLTYLFKNFFEGEGQVSMIDYTKPNKYDSVENSQSSSFEKMTLEMKIVTKPIAYSTPTKARKSLVADQKSNVSSSDSRFSETFHEKPWNAAFAAAFHAELKEKLQQQRLKFEQSLVVNKEDHRLCEGAVGSIIIKKSYVEERVLSVYSNNEKNRKTSTKLTPNHEVEEDENEEKGSFSSYLDPPAICVEEEDHTPEAKRVKFDEGIREMNGYDTFPRTNAKARGTPSYERQTPIGAIGNNKKLKDNNGSGLLSKRSTTLSRCARIQRKLDFEKEELDRTPIKLENRRKIESTNRTRVILTPLRRHKNPIQQQ